MCSIIIYTTVSSQISSQNVYAPPLCLKEGASIEGKFIFTDESIYEYLEICPSYKKDMKKYFKMRIGHDAQVDSMASILAYMLGDSLKTSHWIKNRVLANQYLRYSFRLAEKYGITNSEHLATLLDIDTK